MDDRPTPAKSRSNVLAIASLTLSAISLFVAISGAANAGPGKLPANSVGPKQLQDDAVTKDDVAPNAITTQALAAAAVKDTKLASGAVTDTKLAPGAVTEQAVAQNAITESKIKDGAVKTEEIAPEAVIASKLGPRAVSVPALSIPELLVHASGLSTTLDMGDCQGMDFVSFTGVRSNPASMFSASDPTKLVAPVDGVYSLTLRQTWSDSNGYARGAYVSRARGAALDVVGILGEAPGPTGYPQTIDGGTYELQAGDALKVAPVACEVGETPATAPTLTSFDAGMKWVAQPEG